jgi:hypothetical protein
MKFWCSNLEKGVNFEALEMGIKLCHLCSDVPQEETDINLFWHPASPEGSDPEVGSEDMGCQVALYNSYQIIGCFWTNLRWA